ncbi:MAG: HEAT repeat domain-containing protein [Ktedonobacteraceae bacterium]|nr:HEAT repeat domain-containing protein [Ktedonobacteraceae bacterium]
MLNFEQLIQALHSSSDERRRKAAEALRQHGEPGGQLSAEALIHMLLHDTTPLRKAAAEILREWHEYVPIEPLFLAMHDANVQVRSTTMWALADVGKYAQQESLLPHLTDPDPMVHAAVLYALGKRAPVASVLEALSAPEEILREAAVSLVDLLKEQVPIEQLLSMLQAKDARIRATAARALGNLGEAIPIELLIEALHDAEADVRLEAVRALANSGERMPGAALHVLFDDADQRIRQAAVKALVRVGDPAALEIIVNNLHADHEWARETALQRLIEGTNVEIDEIARHLPIEELLHLLKDEWWPVGYMAARMIAMLGEDAPLAEILALLPHPLPQARWAALHVLALLGKHLPLSECIPIESVLTALEAEDVETRRGAAEVLGYFGQRVPVKRLLPLIEEEDIQVARVVAKRGWQEGRNALVASLRTRDHAWHAAAALGELGEHAPVDPLLAALNTSERTVRQAASEVLYETHPELLPPLVAELMETLNSGQVGPLLEPLRQVLLVRALVALHSPQPAILTWFDQSLDAPNWEVRMWAAFGLSGMTPLVLEATLEKLRNLLDDPESVSVRKAACRALEELVPHATDLHRE